MKNTPQVNLARIGELALLKKLFRRLPARADVVVGAGDDCAVVKGARADKYDYLLKSDGVVEGIHFQPDARPELIGHKALGRVLSDIAAMGGEPLWILVDLVVPGKTSVKRIEQIYAGMGKLARKFGAAIVGGDVSAGKELQLHVFGMGRVKKGKSVLRSGAKAGDAIFVTGSLGGSLAGKHLNFQPRLREGKWIADGKWATAMIDISDGLLRDLGHIASASRAGARLMLDKIPVSMYRNFKKVGPDCSPRRSSPFSEVLSKTDALAKPGQSGRPDERAAGRGGPALPLEADKVAIQIALRASGWPNSNNQSRPNFEANRATPPRLGVASGEAWALEGISKELYHALSDGEDYELLFTVPAHKSKTFLKSWRREFKLACTRIGWITAQKGRLEGIDSRGKIIKLNDAGFEHFR